MYADFESILEPISRPSNNPEMPSTRGVNIHTPSGWCIRSESTYRKVKNPTTLYRGPYCVKKFCEHVVKEARRLYRLFPEKPMEPLTKAQVKSHNRAKTCYICFKPFKDGDRNLSKVRDHCHYSRKYRGAAHSSCNLQYKIPSYIPMVFHNLAGYDAHLFIRELSKYGSKVGVIAKSMEDYISFSIKVEADNYVDKNGEERPKKIDLRFIDSIKFMSSSLDSLVNNLASSNYRFFGFEEYNEKQHALLIRKGIYPYEYMDSWDRFKETNLPSASSFYSKLSMSRVNDGNYEHAHRVWRDFGIRNMGEYHDLYLKTDIILLENIIKEFRRVCMENYGLDLAHFHMAPGLAWKACLKKTKVRLELLLNMLLMFERGIRGGITQSIH